jgi:hypothetical protein
MVEQHSSQHQLDEERDGFNEWDGLPLKSQVSHAGYTSKDHAELLHVLQVMVGLICACSPRFTHATVVP